MDESVMSGLVEWVSGMDAGQIKAALQSSAAAPSLRDIDALAKFLYARANGLA
jgi:hypothetical protein